MKLIKGFDLSDINAKINLSIAEKIELSQALLKAYQTQINNLNMVHRDIKPPNIKVEYVEGKSIVNFIDYDNYTLEGTMPQQNINSPGFTPPEGLGGTASYAQDIYSLGKVLNQLWTRELRNNHLSSETGIVINAIDNMIQEMTMKEPGQRVTIENLNKKMNDIHFDNPIDNTEEQIRKLNNARRYENSQ